MAFFRPLSNPDKLPASLSFCPCRPSRVSRIGLASPFLSFSLPLPKPRTSAHLRSSVHMTGLFVYIPDCIPSIPTSCLHARWMAVRSFPNPSLHFPSPVGRPQDRPRSLSLSRRKLYHHACGRRLFRLTWFPPSALPCPASCPAQLARLCTDPACPALPCQPVPMMRLFHAAALKHSRSTHSSSDAMCLR